MPQLLGKILTGKCDFQKKQAYLILSPISHTPLLRLGSQKVGESNYLARMATFYFFVDMLLCIGSGSGAGSPKTLFWGKSHWITWDSLLGPSPEDCPPCCITWWWMCQALKLRAPSSSIIEVVHARKPQLCTKTEATLPCRMSLFSSTTFHTNVFSSLVFNPIWLELERTTENRGLWIWICTLADHFWTLGSGKQVDKAVLPTKLLLTFTCWWHLAPDITQ